MDARKAVASDVDTLVEIHRAARRTYYGDLVRTDFVDLTLPVATPS